MLVLPISKGGVGACGGVAPRAAFRWLTYHPSLTPECGFGAWGIKEKFNKHFFLVWGPNN